jgi:hypothetical protein
MLRGWTPSGSVRSLLSDVMPISSETPLLLSSSSAFVSEGKSVTFLHQVLALEPGVRSRTSKTLTDLHRKLGKDQPLSGLTRNYEPRDAEGEKLPGERTQVQVKADEALTLAAEAFTNMFDVVATKDHGNTEAFGPVVVDGATLFEAPATFLLWLEKQLVDLHTFVSKLPTLDPAETWTYDANSGAFRTDTLQSTRTKKVPRNHVKAEATDRHPAQVDVYYEDVIVGDWKTVKFSGALPADRVRTLLTRVEKVQDAVKSARQAANSVEVELQKVGSTIFDYVFEA